MKKYALHIFILIVLCTLLVPTFEVKAQNEMGVCFERASNKVIKNPSTPAECAERWVNIDTAASIACLNPGISNILCKIHQILNTVIPVIVALGMVYFVWGVVQYVIAGGEEAKKTGKDRIIYGIIGLAIIVSLWGLVNILANTFGLGSVSSPTLSASPGCDTSAPIKTFQNLAGFITCTIKDSVVPLIFALALVTFIWGVVKFFIIDADEEAKRSQGKQFMIWGLIALTVMLCVWGLVAILGSTFKINNTIPQLCDNDPSTSAPQCR